MYSVELNIQLIHCDQILKMTFLSLLKCLFFYKIANIIFIYKIKKILIILNIEN